MSTDLYFLLGLPDFTIARKLFENAVTIWEVELS